MAGGGVQGQRDWFVKERGAKFGIRVCQAGCVDPIRLRPGLEVELERARAICLVGHWVRDPSMRLHKELAIRRAAQQTGKIDGCFHTIAPILHLQSSRGRLLYYT
jgi:hypothetical protein